MLSWGNDQVLLWLKNSGYDDATIDSFRAHNITGLSIPLINSADLKEMGIESLKLRLSILADLNKLISSKASGNNGEKLGLSHPLLVELQSVVIGTAIVKSVSKSIVEETSTQLLTHHNNNNESSGSLTGKKEYKILLSKINKLKEEILPVLKDIQDKKPLPAPESIKPSTYTPAPIFTNSNLKSLSNVSSPMPSPIANTHLSSSTSAGNHDNTLKQLRAKTEDPCYKIIQSAMRSHKLDKNEWRKYVLVIIYGGDKERVLRYDEKPVVVFKELNELGLSPSMMLRQVEESDNVNLDKFLKNNENLDIPGGRI